LFATSADPRAGAVERSKLTAAEKAALMALVQAQRPR